MGFNAMSIGLIVLVTAITVYIEWSVGQIVEEEHLYKVVFSAGLMGVVVLDAVILISPLCETICDYLVTNSEKHDFPIDLRVLAMVGLLIVVDVAFLWLCCGAGIDSFNGRPRHK